MIPKNLTELLSIKAKKSSIKESRAVSKISLSQKLLLTTCGIFLFFILLEIILRLSGFIYLSLQEHRNTFSSRMKDECRILCLGESTTAGGKHSYPSLLEVILKRANPKMKFCVINKGVPGTNSSYILSGLKENLNKYKPDIVVTMIGINDTENDLYDLIEKEHQGHDFFKDLRVFKLVRLIWMSMPVRLSALKLKDDNAYISLARVYENKAQYTQAIKLYKKAISINPYNEWAYFGLRWSYFYEGRFQLAEDSFKKSIEVNMGNPELFDGIRWLYLSWGNYDAAEKTLMQALGRFSCSSGYVELGFIYKTQKNYSKAQRAYLKAIEINPKAEEAYIELGWLYAAQKEYQEAEKIFKKFIEENPQNNKAYASLIALYEKTGEIDIAEKYRQEAEKISAQVNITDENYKKIKEILDENGVKLVCVQYPMRSIQLLKKVFKDNVVLVDNETDFREALKGKSYSDYFDDMFAGDFGHCTRKGNMIIAINIAKAILFQLKKSAI